MHQASCIISLFQQFFYLKSTIYNPPSNIKNKSDSEFRLRLRPRNIWVYSSASYFETNINMSISFARTKETNQKKVRHERRIGLLQCFPKADTTYPVKASIPHRSWTASLSPHFPCIQNIILMYFVIAEIILTGILKKLYINNITIRQLNISRLYSIFTIYLSSHFILHLAS